MKTTYEELHKRIEDARKIWSLEKCAKEDALITECGWDPKEYSEEYFKRYNEENNTFWTKVDQWSPIGVRFGKLLPSIIVTFKVPAGIYYYFLLLKMKLFKTKEQEEQE